MRTSIHPGAHVARLARLGHNVLVMAGAVITSNALIGDHVCVLPNTVIHHDVTVGNFSLIGANVAVAGSVAIGENCYIGSGTNIMNGVRIGARALVGLGSNVIRDVPEGATVAGNPARPLPKNCLTIEGYGMKIKGSKILVTGGCGLVGSTTIDLLLRDYDPAQIVIIDNLNRGTLHNVDEALKDPRVSLVRGDIRDVETMHEVTQGMDAVIHMATLRITACAAEPREALGVMCDGSFNVLEAAQAAGVKKVVAASSASIYGLAEQFPTREDHHPYANRTWYGASKIMLEGLLRSYNDMYKLPYVALRYFNVYGPRMDLHGRYTEVLIRWMDRIAAGQPPLILGDGKTTMDFIYIEDVARSNILALRIRPGRRRVQRRERRRDQPQRSRRRAAARDGQQAQARVRP